jgi:uncharacterized membrane protein YphA (DoxX/SURF4 family)
MFRKLMETQPRLSLLWLRLLLGAVMFPHGAQKLLGWFGGFGFSGSMGYFTGQVGTPWLVGFLVILGEFFGGHFGPAFLFANHLRLLRSWRFSISRIGLECIT